MQKMSLKRKNWQKQPKMNEMGSFRWPFFLKVGKRLFGTVEYHIVCITIIAIGPKFQNLC